MSAPNFYALLKKSEANVRTGMDLLFAWGDLVQAPADDVPNEKLATFVDLYVQKLITWLQTHDKQTIKTGLRMLADKASQATFFSLGPPS